MHLDTKDVASLLLNIAETSCIENPFLFSLLILMAFRSFQSLKIHLRALSMLQRVTLRMHCWSVSNLFFSDIIIDSIFSTLAKVFCSTSINSTWILLASLSSFDVSAVPSCSGARCYFPLAPPVKAMKNCREGTIFGLPMLKNERI